MKAGTGRRSFTLIEMLMVIIIIFMLSLIVFRLMRVLDNRAAMARTVYVLKQLQNALNEYKIEYGIYPPVGAVVQYEYESPTNQTSWFRTFLAQHNNPQDIAPGSGTCFWTDRGTGCPGGADFPAHQPGELGYTGHPQYPGSWHLEYRYGLVAHLDFRSRGQAHWYDRDTSRDSQAKQRWAPFMAGLVGGAGYARHDVSQVVGTLCRYSNRVDTIRDGFGNEVRYECYAPYTSYRLWATTPLGLVNSASVGGP